MVPRLAVGISVVIEEPIMPRGTHFTAMLALRDAARAAMLKHVGEPDFGCTGEAAGGRITLTKSRSAISEPLTVHTPVLSAICGVVPPLRGVSLQYPVGIQTECTVEEMMAWTTPTLVEICIGLEINGYLPAEF